jgi:hypothetical protein
MLLPWFRTSVLHYAFPKETSEFKKQKEVQEGTNPPTYFTSLNKLNIVYKNITLHIITKFYRVVQRLSRHNLNISHHRHN